MARPTATPRTAEDDAAVKWLQDAGTQSQYILAKVGQGTTPPDTGNGSITIQGGNMAKPRNEDELRTLLQNAAATPVMIDPTTPEITCTDTIDIIVHDNYRFYGNGLKLKFPGVSTSKPGLKFHGAAYNVLVHGIKVFGDYPSPSLSDAFQFIADELNGFWHMNLDDLRAEHNGGNGFLFSGIFEGQASNCWTNGCMGNGAVFENAAGNTMTQFNTYNFQMSRVNGWGIVQQNSADQVSHYGPVFVCNGLGGLYAPNGLHLVDNPKGENCGETLITVDNPNWPGGEVRSPQLASDGHWVRPGVSGAKVSRYVVRCPPNAVTVTGVPKLRGYGGPVDLWAPGSQKAGVEQEEYSSDPLTREAKANQQQARPMQPAPAVPRRGRG